MEIVKEWLAPASSSKTAESFSFAFKKALEEFALPAGSVEVERLTTIDELHEPTEIFGHLPGDKRGLFWEYVNAGVSKGLAISYSCEKSFHVEIDDALLNHNKVVFYKATQPMTMASLENKHLPYESKARLAGHVASGTRMTEAELNVFKLPTCPRVKLDATGSPEPQKTRAGNAEDGWCSFEVKPGLGLGMSGNAALHDLVRVQMHFPPINYPHHWSQMKPALSKKGAKPLEFKDLLSAQGNKLMGELLDAYADSRLKRMDFQVQEAYKPAPGALWKGQTCVQRRKERRHGHLTSEDEGGDNAAAGDGAAAAAAAGCGAPRKKQKLQAELGGPCTRSMAPAAVAAAASEDAASA